MVYLLCYDKCDLERKDLADREVDIASSYPTDFILAVTQLRMQRLTRFCTQQTQIRSRKIADICPCLVCLFQRLLDPRGEAIKHIALVNPPPLDEHLDGAFALISIQETYVLHLGHLLLLSYTSLHSRNVTWTLCGQRPEGMQYVWCTAASGALHCMHDRCLPLLVSAPGTLLHDDLG